MKITERIFDAATGETNDIERQMTTEEIAIYKEREAARLEAAKQRELDEIKKKEAEEKLAKLGLSIDDLKALGLG